jgi:hypothetical protein
MVKYWPVSSESISCPAVSVRQVPVATLAINSTGLLFLLPTLQYEGPQVAITYIYNYLLSKIQWGTITNSPDHQLLRLALCVFASAVNQ